MKSIVFRTMGGAGIGYGHFFRSYSLAKAFKRFYKNAQITFIINKELEEQFMGSEFYYLSRNSFDSDVSIVKEMKPELFVLDSYLANNDYITEIKKSIKVMIFDDNNDIYNSTIPDVILNGNIHAKSLSYKSNKNSLFLLGPKYLVMREDYWEESNLENKANSTKDGILITTGGSDSYDISYKILSTLKNLPYKKSVIIGPGYEQNLIVKLESLKDENIKLIFNPISLREYISEHKIAITAGGSTVYEIISQNTIPIVFSIAENQDIACEYFEEKGVIYLGKYPEIKYDNIEKEVLAIIEGKVSTDSDIFNLVDGQGAKRVVKALTRRLQWSEDYQT